MDMKQTIQALSHYWHLREQGKSPRDAAQHVEQRFGVRLDSGSIEDNARMRSEMLTQLAPATSFGEDFAKTIKGTSTGPVDGLRAGS